MFASARTAAAAPLASPTLKHVFEFTHTQSSRIGLGIHVSPPTMASASGSASSFMHTGLAQAENYRPILHRVQSPVIAPPRTPRLQSAAAFPSVFSPFTLSPGVQSPVSEGYFSDDDNSSEIMEALASGVQSMNVRTIHRRRFAFNGNGTTNNLRATFRSSLNNALPGSPEVARIGLGISGITLNRSTIVPNVESNDAPASAPQADPTRTVMSQTLSTKSVGFSAREQIINSENNESDGYAADMEHEDRGPQRVRRLNGSASSSVRSCKGRKLTPFYAPNGEASWL